MSRKPYTPERAFRVSVMPLSIFFIVSGAVFVIVAAFVDGRFIHMPPFGPTGAKVAFGLVGLVLIIVGAGMLRRSRLAWYGMFAYLALGGIWYLALGVAFLISPPGEPEPGALFYLAGVAWTTLIGTGLYFVTYPVFRSGDARNGGSGLTSDERPAPTHRVGPTSGAEAPGT